MVKSIFNVQQIEFIKSNYENMSYTDMSKLPLFENINGTQIRNKARVLGCSRARKFSKRYFQFIDSEVKAYWLGFIYADGFLTYNKERRNYELGIEIHTDDKYILDLLNYELGNSHKITSRKRNISFNGYDYISNCSRIRVYSKDICDDLIAHGIVPDKTNSNKHPLIQDDILFLHFLRGFLDGDGCIYQKDNKLQAVHFTNANVPFLEYVQKRLDSLNIKSTIYREKDKKYRLNISLIDSKMFLDLIYKNSSIKLERKYTIYKNLL